MKSLCCITLALTGLLISCDRTAKNQAQPAPAAQPSTQPATQASGLVPLELKLPRPIITGTPKDMPPNTTALKPTGQPRPPFMVAPGVTLLSRGKPVSASDTDPSLGDLKMITDGDKSGIESSLVELGPGSQWVQVDLGREAPIHAIALWHDHRTFVVYRAVIVQLSNDPDFTTGVTTIYNNDHANAQGLGLGSEREYLESYEGKLIPVPALKARYVRCYSKGNTDDDLNRYDEVEVYGMAQ